MKEDEARMTLNILRMEKLPDERVMYIKAIKHVDRHWDR